MFTKGLRYISLLAILFLTGMGVVLAGYFSANEIVDVRIREKDKETEIFLRMKEVVEPIVKLDSHEEALRFDFLDVQVNKSLLKKVLKADFIRLGYFFNYKGTFKVAGLKIFPENSGVKSIKKEADGVLITLAKSSSAAIYQHKHSATLLSPRAGRYAPVKLDLQQSPCLPVILTLAKQAEIEIQFSKFIPESISLELAASNPLDAILQIAASFGGKFEQKEGGWLLTGVDL